MRQILVIDDDPDLLAVVSLALTALGGYTVYTSGSLEDAVESAESFRPDMILLDIMMPGVDGFGILRELRAAPTTRDTPVVFMSALQVQRGDVIRYEALGCLGLIPKPFDPATLPDTVEALWRLHARRKAEAHQTEFETLRRTYIAELGEKTAAMDAAAAALAAHGWDRPVVESLYLMAHRIAGSSALYRMVALSRSAGALEEILKRLLNGPSWPPSSSPSDLARLVQAVGRTAKCEADLSSSAPAPARTGWRRVPAASRPRSH